MKSEMSFNVHEFSFPCLMIVINDMDNEEEARKRLVVLFTEPWVGTVVVTDKNKGLNAHHKLGEWHDKWKMENFKYLPELSVNLSNL